MDDVIRADDLPAAPGPADLRAAFDPVPGFLNAASVGLPPRAARRALHEAVDTWAAGRAQPADYDEIVARSRALYAGLVGVDPAAVAIGSQTSAMLGPVAAAVPDGADVVCVDGDFTSVVFPFAVHADRGVRVRHVPLAGLADAVAAGTDVVAFSLAQSADGEVADAEAVLAAAASVGARTVCDVTQAAGWLPVEAGRFDVTVCSAYKWLCCPRGVAFSTVRDGEAMRPLHAGWYAGQDVWSSVYGPGMRLAEDARRFDVSPAWLAWAGAAPALELLSAAAPDRLRSAGADLADALRARLGLEPAGRPVVSLPDEDGARRAALESAGCVVASRAGRVRIAFHLWNDEGDVDLAAGALGA